MEFMPNHQTKWVTAWGNAISIAERRPENYAKNLTLRYPIKMMLNGEALRIRLDNFCGTESATISCITLAKAGTGSDILPDTVVPVTFQGNTAITIPAEETALSDAIPFSVKAGETIAVSLYFETFVEMRSAVHITGPFSCGFFAIGNQTKEAELPQDASKKTNWFYFLSDIEVLTAAQNRTIVCYGDSITAQAWPDYLIHRTLTIGDGSTAVIRKAASGTRILRQYDNITYDSYGLKGSTRFPREVPVSGADTVIIQHGINDIIHPVGVEVNPFRPWSDLPSAQEIIDGLRCYVEMAKQWGLNVYLGTLLPIEGWRTYADFRESLRNEVNTWMRTTTEADGCIDFDRAVCAPDHVTAFAEGMDSGDHLHPSQIAYQRMAEEVPLHLLTRDNSYEA